MDSFSRKFNSSAAISRSQDEVKTETWVVAWQMLSEGVIPSYRQWLQPNYATQRERQNQAARLHDELVPLYRWIMFFFLGGTAKRASRCRSATFSSQRRASRWNAIELSANSRFDCPHLSSRFFLSGHTRHTSHYSASWGRVVEVAGTIASPLHCPVGSFQFCQFCQVEWWGELQPWVHSAESSGRFCLMRLRASLFCTLACFPE